LSTVTNRVAIVAVEQSQFAPDISAYWGSSTLNKTSYTPAEAATARSATNNLNWSVLAAQNPTEDNRSFSDDFNRASLGSLWATSTSSGQNLRISDGRLAYNGAANGYQSALYIRATASDAQRVDADLEVTPQSNARLGVLMHCSRYFHQVVALLVNASSAAIYSGTIASLTLRESVNVGGSGRWSIYYDVDLDKYVVLKDDEPIGLEWQPTGIQHGPDYRFGGVQITRANSVKAGTIDNFTIRDWVPEQEESEE